MKRAAALAAYSVLMGVLAPLLMLRLLWRSRAEPLYRHALGERLGWYRGAPSRGWLWLHAVSLGETRAAQPLVAALREQRPSLRLLLTHGTATGREAGRELMREGDAQVWLPLDSAGAVRRFLRHWRPAVGVLMETEIWPNLLRAAERAQVPMVLANARLSARSLRQAQRHAALLRPAAQRLSLVLAQAEADAQRLAEAGAPQPEVVGNLKYDLQPDPVLTSRGREWRAALGRAVVLAASTREGEEAPLLDAWCRRPAPRPLLLVVPRHPQRFDDVARQIQARGLSLVRRSELAGAGSAGEALQADVWLGDSMGEMALYYAMADVALLGGSFAPLGGQNLIEAAACGCPLVMGPHTFNFADAAQKSLEAGAALRVDDLEAGVERAWAIAHGQGREAMVQGAAAFSTRHRGAARRSAQRILRLVRPSSTGAAPT